MFKCTDFLTTNITTFGSNSQKLNNRSTFESRHSSKENIRSEFTVVDDSSCLKNHSNIPLKNNSTTENIKSLENSKQQTKKTPIIKIKLDRKRMN